jgi:hypothetical protein
MGKSCRPADGALMSNEPASRRRELQRRARPLAPVLDFAQAVQGAERRRQTTYLRQAHDRKQALQRRQNTLCLFGQAQEGDRPFAKPPPRTGAADKAHSARPRRARTDCRGDSAQLMVLPVVAGPLSRRAGAARAPVFFTATRSTATTGHRLRSLVARRPTRGSKKAIMAPRAAPRKRAISRGKGCGGP